jgi:hypothetical protein
VNITEGSLQSVTLIIETAREAVKQGLKSDPESSRYDIAFSSKEHDRTREVVSNFIDRRHDEVCEPIKCNPVCYCD